jgi:hypothetical protein
MSRAAPFPLVFGSARERFERLRQSLASEQKDPRDRDALLLSREAAELLHELRPEEGFGDATEAAAALLHHAYLFWASGEVVRTVPYDVLTRILARPPGRRATEPPIPPYCYVQLPALAIWGVLEDSPPEPLDGWFATRLGDRLHGLAVFGLRPGRVGFTTLEVSGTRPGLAMRHEPVPLFAPITTEQGVAAGIGAVTSEAELLELCWRIEDIR